MNRIYYFSATGNSLVVAREVAAHLGECEIVHVADAMNDSEPSKRFERIGFVHPVYGWGPPRMVHDFIDGCVIPEADYYFAIATHGGTGASALQVLSRQLSSRSVPLHAGFSVKEGHYQPDPDHAKHPAVRFVRAMNRHPDERARSFAERRDEILTPIEQMRHCAVEFDNRIGSVVARLFHPISLRTFATSDRTFFQTADCVACGICTTVCPRCNVHLEDSKLSWGGDCEGCFACVQWCPKSAIGIRGVDRITQGHNPSCRAKDLDRTR